MKLAETKFEVRYNKAFLWAFGGAGESHVAWVVLNAARFLDTRTWEANARVMKGGSEEGLDAWMHEVALKGRSEMLAACPYPPGVLSVYLEGRGDTVPTPDDCVTLRYPEDFRAYEGQSDGELGILRFDRG